MQFKTRTFKGETLDEVKIFIVFTVNFEDYQSLIFSMISHNLPRKLFKRKNKT